MTIGTTCLISWNASRILQLERKNKIEAEENGKLHNNPYDVANALNNFFATCVENLRSEKAAMEPVTDALGTSPPE